MPNGNNPTPSIYETTTVDSCTGGRGERKKEYKHKESRKSRTGI